MSLTPALVRAFPEKARRTIPQQQQQALRNQLATELSFLRGRRGFGNDIPVFAVIAGVPQEDIFVLEGARPTDTSVTLLTLHKIATKHHAQVILDEERLLELGGDFLCGATTTVERFIGMGVNIRLLDLDANA